MGPITHTEKVIHISSFFLLLVVVVVWYACACVMDTDFVHVSDFSVLSCKALPEIVRSPYICFPLFGFKFIRMNRRFFGSKVTKNKR